MSLVTISGLETSEVRFISVKTGAWHLDALVQSPDALTGAVTVDLGGDLTLQGAVLVGGVYVEALHVRVLAGKGRWQAAAVPKFYAGATLGTILSDVLAQGGETLAAMSDTAARNVVLPAFASTSGSIGANVRALMEYAPAGTSWRFLPDGTFWIGPETWPAFAPDYQVTDEEPRERRVDVGTASPSLIAGQSVVNNAGDVLHINRVELAVSANAIRARAWWQP